VKLALPNNPHIRLLVLSRQPKDEQFPDYISVLKVIKENNMEQRVRIVTGFLSQEQLIQRLSECDAIALPFELVPSDVPISILEALALGIPLITTNVACLPELVPAGTGILLPPGNAPLLGEAILKLSADIRLRQNLANLGKKQAMSWVSASDNHEVWNNLLYETVRR